MKIIFLSLLIFFSILSANNVNEKKVKKEIDTLEKPLYNPFVENYLLNEIKQLRDANRDLKIDLHKTLAKKEVEMSNYVINYATSTINNMFYIITAASSILVMIGWTSIKDLNKKVKIIVDEKISETISSYENKLELFEKDLEKRTKQVHKNQQDIAITNIIHSLWLRASQESTLNGKIEIYDEILEIRPDEVEALIYKADAILDLDEANWALSLTNQALEIDNNYPNAFYQRAKVYAVLNQEENAITDLEKAVLLNEQYIQEIKNDNEFKSLLHNERIKKLFERLI